MRADLEDLLHNRSYVALWIGQLISWVGNSFHKISLFFLLMSKAPEGAGYLPLLNLLLVHILAYVVFSPIAGVFVDRWDRKRTMIATDIIRAVLVLCIPFATSQATLYVLTFLVTTTSLFFEPARTAALPGLVKPSQLFMANSFMTTSESIAETIGFFSGGVVVATLGYRSAFYFDSVSFLVSALTIGLVTLPPAIRAGRESALHGKLSEIAFELRQGFLYAVGKAEIGAIFILYFLMGLGLGSANYLLPFFANDGLGGPAAYGAITGALTLGYLLGSILVGFLCSRANKIAMIGTGLLGMGLGVIWIAQSRTLPFAVIGGLIGGLANPVYYVASRTYLQEVAPDEIRGRVFSLQFFVVQLGFFGSVWIARELLTRMTVGSVLTFFGILLALTGALGPQVGTLRRMRSSAAVTQEP